MDERDKVTFNVESQTIGVLSRKRVRNLLLRKRGGFDMTVQDRALAQAVWDIMHEQVKGHFTLDDFTFQWDIHPKNPLKVITPFQWEQEGGKHDPITGMRDPAAFTRQPK